MELGSPMTKIRRVRIPQEATPGVSGEPSQTEQKGGLINLTNSSDEEMVATRVHPVKVKTKELDDDDIFTGLTDHDKDRVMMIMCSQVLLSYQFVMTAILVMRKIMIWTRSKCSKFMINNRETGTQLK